MTGGATYSDGYIPLLNSSGFLDVRAGGTGTGSSYGSGNILLTQGSGAFKEASNVPVSNGGTGSGSLSVNHILIGNGTSAIKSVGHGSRNDVLWSDGSAWTTTGGIIAPQLVVNKSLSDVSPDITSTDWVVCDSDLSANITVGTGALLQFNFITTVWNDTNPSYMYFDFGIGNGRVSNADTGLVIQADTSASNGDYQAINISMYHLTETGGTLTVTPKCKTDTGTMSVGRAFFQVVKFRD